LKATYSIHDCDFVGHDDITVHRTPSQGGPKQDPGILYPWGLLHEKFGIGAWLTESERTKESIVRLYKPEEDLPAEVDVDFMARYLHLYGYKVEANATLEDSTFKNALRSFRAHFSHNQNPSAYKAEIDEHDMFWIWALVAKYGPYNARRVFE
jgi:N-acetylmuramoyl-L-alanine amidase